MKWTSALAASALLATHFAVVAHAADSTVYRCENAGVPTYSDRPCGTAAQIYEADVSRVSTYTPPPPTASTSIRSRPAQTTRRVRQPSIAESQAKRAADCDRILSSLRDIRTKMRAGYGAQEGERLRARQAKLGQRRRAQRCR